MKKYYIFKNSAIELQSFNMHLPEITENFYISNKCKKNIILKIKIFKETKKYDEIVKKYKIVKKYNKFINILVIKNRKHYVFNNENALCYFDGDCLTFISQNSLSFKFIKRLIRSIFIINEIKNGKGYYFHGATIEQKSNGITIIGDKFVGKTTLLLNFLNKNSNNLITNDKSLIYIENNNVNIYGLPFDMGVRKETLSLFSVFNGLKPFKEKEFFTPQNICTMFNNILLTFVKNKIFILPNYSKDLRGAIINKITDDRKHEILKNSLILDIHDNFKFLNDYFGEINYDELLANIFIDKLKKLEIYEINYNQNCLNEVLDFINKVV